METHKWRFLCHLLERTGQELELLLEAMLVLEEQTRLSYAEPIKDIGSQEFAEMMLLDACFVLELLRTSVQGFIHCGYSWVDPIFTARGLLPCIQRDLLMLENQLPLFVLDRLFELGSKPDEPDSVTQLALQFFKLIIPGCQHHDLPIFKEQGLHLLHVIRRSLLPSPITTLGCVVPNCDNRYRPQLMTHCVASFRDSGITFQKKKNSKSFMDVSFRDGVLYIPPLTIHDSSKSMFLNLMAFEQSYPHCSNHVTSCISFMDGLINCPRDVGYLHYQGIIDHGLGSEEEMARLFNGLCREIAFDVNDCYLSGVSADVNRYFERKWHTWEASLKHQYFSNPWAIISLLAAVFLIALRLMQTFYTVFAYYIPHS